MPDVKIRTGSLDLSTTTGSKDLTISGFGTPKAIMGVITKATTDDTLSDDALIGTFLADDSGNVSFTNFWSAHGQSTTNSNRQFGYTDPAAFRVFDAAILRLIDIDSDDATAGPITDGWRIDVTNAGTGDNVICNFVLFGGADLEANVASIYAYPASGPTVVTPGFETELAFFITSGWEGLDAHGILGIGASNGVSSSFLAANSENAVTTSDTTEYLHSTAAIGRLYQGAIDLTADIGSITSTQYTVTGSTFWGSTSIGILALNLGGLSASVDIIDSPTSTSSDWTVTAPGFEPQFAMLLASSVSAADSVRAFLDVGIALLDADTNQGFTSIQDQDALSIETNTSSLWADQWVSLYNSDEVLLHSIAPSSSPFNANGWTVPAADISTANSTARKWIAITVEAPEEAVEPTANRGGWATNQNRLRRLANLRRDDDELLPLISVIINDD